MQKDDFNIEKLAADSSFISWCLGEEDEQSSQWDTWLADNPNRKEKVQKAKAIVLSLKKSQISNRNSTIKKEAWEGINQHLKTKSASGKNSRSPISIFRNYAGKVAAVLVLGFVAFYLLNPNSNASIQEQWIVQENTSVAPKSILLSDNTTIELSANSQIEYPSNFTGNSREIILNGEAFFDVAKDSTKPFIIYANNTMTKVLGTSFTIKAFEKEDEIEVDVKTGKVEVYSQVGNNNHTDKKRVQVADRQVFIPKPNKKITLTPNQKVVVDIAKRKMDKRITEQPKMLASNSKQPQVSFENESVGQVFNTLEKIYGIDISFDEKALQKCSISTKLNDQPFRTTLNMICDALELKMEEENAVLKITGKGCL